ncbi:MAG: hypothetical protein MUC56_00310 [Thermoanaerobaculales bacterium]|jgi:hypothetical protein|nr:hypothetical protein [Thermoanaerobaculales bacterium]
MNRTLPGDIHFTSGDLGLSQCLWCRHRSVDARRCRAFPDGIPEAIASNRHDHRRTYHGDRGIRFQPEVVEIEFVEVEDEVEPAISRRGSSGVRTAVGTAVAAVDALEFNLEDVSYDLDAVANG